MHDKAGQVELFVVSCPRPVRCTAPDGRQAFAAGPMRRTAPRPALRLGPRDRPGTIEPWSVNGGYANYMRADEP